MARQMIGTASRGAKIRRSAVIPRRSAPQIALGDQVCSKQPKHAVRRGGKEPHPHVEDLRIDLEGIVEAAKHETGLGQTTFAARRHAFGDAALVVIGLMSIGN